MPPSGRLPINAKLAPSLATVAARAGSTRLMMMRELTQAYNAPAVYRQPEPTSHQRGVSRGPSPRKEPPKERRWAPSGSGWFVIVELERNTIVFAGKESTTGEGA